MTLYLIFLFNFFKCILILGGNTSRGLGGHSELHDTSHSMTSSLLKSQYLSMVASMKSSRPVLLNTSKVSKKTKAPRYTLQAGYEKQIELPSEIEKEDIEALTVVPKHVDHFLPLKESILSRYIVFLQDSSLESNQLEPE